MKAKLAAIPSGSGFKFFNANVETLQASIALGADGFCGISANFYPWLHVRLCNQPQGKVADRIQNFLSVAENVVVTAYPRSPKIWLKKLGGEFDIYCRKPGVGEIKEESPQMFQINALFAMMTEVSEASGAKVLKIQNSSMHGIYRNA